MAKLYFRYGAMNSGKTTALMQVAYNYKERGMRVLILKPAIDTKGQDSIISRLGISCKVDQLVTPEMDVVELNEAFASQALACVKNVVNDPYLDGFQEMWDEAKVNPYGSAMALGHPMGATGAFLTCKVLDYLQDPETAGKYGMVTMCIGGGMGACGIYELCK